MTELTAGRSPNNTPSEPQVSPLWGALVKRQQRLAVALLLGALAVGSVVWNGLIPAVPQSLSAVNVFLIGAFGACPLFFWVVPFSLGMRGVWGALSAVLSALVLAAGGETLGVAASLSVGAGVASIALLFWQSRAQSAEIATRSAHGAWLALNLVSFVLMSPYALELTTAVHAAIFDPAAYVASLGAGFSIEFALGRLFAAWPWLHLLSEWVYLGLPAAMALSMAWESRLGTSRMDVGTALFTSGLLGLGAYFWFPVVGPIFAYADQWPHALPSLDPNNFEPLVFSSSLAPRNCMPSLHTAWVMVLWWHTRTFGLYFRVGMFIFTAITLLSTMGLGAHYSVDILVGICFAAGTNAALWCPRRPQYAALGFGLGLLWLALVWQAPGWLAGAAWFGWPAAIATLVVVLRARWLAEQSLDAPSADATSHTAPWAPVLPMLGLGLAAGAGLSCISLLAAPWVSEGSASLIAILPGVWLGVHVRPNGRALRLVAAGLWLLFPWITPPWLTFGGALWWSSEPALSLVIAAFWMLPWSMTLGWLFCRPLTVTGVGFLAMGTWLGALGLPPILGASAAITTALGLGASAWLWVRPPADAPGGPSRTPELLAGGAVGAWLALWTVLCWGLTAGASERLAWLATVIPALAAGAFLPAPRHSAWLLALTGAGIAGLSLLSAPILTVIVTHAPALAEHPYAIAEPARAALRTAWSGLILLPWALAPGLALWVWRSYLAPAAPPLSLISALVSLLSFALVLLFSGHPGPWVTVAGATAAAAGLLLCLRDSQGRWALHPAALIPAGAGLALGLVTFPWPDGALAAGALARFSSPPAASPARTRWTSNLGVIADWPERGRANHGRWWVADQSAQRAAVEPWLKGQAVAVWAADAVAGPLPGLAASCLNPHFPPCTIEANASGAAPPLTSLASLLGTSLSPVQVWWAPVPPPPWETSAEALAAVRARLTKDGVALLHLDLGRYTPDDLLQIVANASGSFAESWLGRLAPLEKPMAFQPNTHVNDTHEQKLALLVLCVSRGCDPPSRAPRAQWNLLPNEGLPAPSGWANVEQHLISPPAPNPHRAARW